MSSTIRARYPVHKWTSFACTVFPPMLCFSGLPLIFHDEIDRVSGGAPDLGLAGVGSSWTAAA
ncbi:hypothetical protein [Novosphingobium guangzhouense]|uniref:hypothetical protein n=1 Tax=Novosphingobium guangzhouense TaxID=1850347 RepID=UPI00147540A3|nr:hypothetical protein [Novosphingobium guangzhouense]